MLCPVSSCRWLVLAMAMLRFYIQKGTHKGLYRSIARTLKFFQTFALVEVRVTATVFRVGVSHLYSHRPSPRFDLKTLEKMKMSHKLYLKRNKSTHNKSVLSCRWDTAPLVGNNLLAVHPSAS